MKQMSLPRLETEVLEAVNTLAPDSRLLVGVSGGADSVALLVALCRLGRQPVAAHCNFHLRGEESDRDQHFVECLCERLGVELRLVHFDVEAYRAGQGGSMEMACRELRYEWFDRLRTELGCARLLTAHHADDNVETMLLNMLRGCGLQGAKGMVSDTGVIMRPLLRLHRADIESYLREVGETWIVDSTNLQAEPDRNFLRLEVLPLLEKRFPGAVGRLARTQRHLGEAYKIYADWRETLDGEFLNLDSVDPSSHGLTVIHEWVRPFGFTSVQVAEMHRAAAAPRVHTSVWTAPAGQWMVLLEKGGFRRVSVDAPVIEIQEQQMPVTDALLGEIRANTDRQIAYFRQPLSSYLLRHHRPGDRLCIGSRKTKKVADVLKEGGIPAPWRKSWPVLADGERVLWVVGVRRGSAEPVTADCEICYRLTCRRRES